MALAEQKRWLNVMEELNLQGNRDRSVFEFAQRNAETQDALVKRLIGEQGEVGKQQGQDIKIFIQETSAHSFKLASFLPEVVFALRAELEMPLDREAYMRIVEEHQKLGQEVLARLMSEVETAVIAQRKGGVNKEGGGSAS